MGPPKVIAGDGFKGSEQLSAADLRKLTTSSKQEVCERLLGNWDGRVLAAVTLKLSNDTRSIANAQIGLIGDLLDGQSKAFYRLMNKVETFQEGPDGIPDPDNIDAFLQYARRKMDTEAVFTSCHQTMGWHKYNAAVLYVRHNLSKICGKLAKLKTLSSAFDELKEIQNFGPFLSWQVLCDLTESKVLEVSGLDDYAVPGPGAEKGIAFIYGHARKSLHQEQMAELAKIVREAEEACNDDDGKLCLGLPAPLKINSKLIEHALCEFSKYVRFSAKSEISRKVWKSRAHLDTIKHCIVCTAVGGDGAVFCLLCNQMLHSACINYKVDRKSYVCYDCRSIEGMELK